MKKIGIAENTEQRIVSGARVAFDPRTTAQADETRDPTNHKKNKKEASE